MKRVIDAHIHLDLYKESDRLMILDEMGKYEIDKLITVSNHLDSARKNIALARQNEAVEVAFGFHPEQAIPTEEDMEKLQQFIYEHQEEMIAIGEVGLPYYLRKENPEIQLEPYIEVLERFIMDAKRFDKPIVLHAVYEDAPVVCSLLEKHSVNKAHFHWFKGDSKTVERMMENGYFVSITPDVLYKKKIQSLVNQYPISQIMVETDGPWPFEGPFNKKLTHPKMIHQSVKKISEMKNMQLHDVYERIYENTRSFYG